MKIIKILLLALLPSLSAISAQETITSTNFKTKTQKGPADLIGRILDDTDESSFEDV